VQNSCPLNEQMLENKIQLRKQICMYWE